jgi:hypothetical protein
MARSRNGKRNFRNRTAADEAARVRENDERAAFEAGLEEGDLVEFEGPMYLEKITTLGARPIGDRLVKGTTWFGDPQLIENGETAVAVFIGNDRVQIVKRGSHRPISRKVFVFFVNGTHVIADPGDAKVLQRI